MTRPRTFGISIQGSDDVRSQTGPQAWANPTAGGGLLRSYAGGCDAGDSEDYRPRPTGTGTGL